MTREEARNLLKNSKPEGSNAYSLMLNDALDMAIEALNQEPRKGHWIYTLEDWNKWECSECGFTKRTDVHVSIGYKYCPGCGCSMKGELE